MQNRTRATNTPGRRANARRDRGGTLIGVFIGLVLGLSLAAGVAYYLMRAGSPFPAQAAKETREPTRTAKVEAGGDKPRFDFYKILPGVEEPKAQADAKKSPDRALVGEARTATDGKSAAVKPSPERIVEKAPDKVAAAEPTPAAKLPERFWLQAGSFATESDAENLKARLAFAGWQANIQQGTLPDKGTRYRVRLGPYENTDELNRIRGDLSRSGFDVAVIKF